MEEYMCLHGHFYQPPRENPWLEALEYLQQLEAAVILETELPYAVLPWKIQHIYYEMLHSVYPQQRQQSEQGLGEARNWVEHFAALGTKLSVKVD